MRSLLAALALVALALLATAAQAGVTSFTSAAAFQAATTTTAFADFEALPQGYYGNPLVTDGIAIALRPGGHPNYRIYVANPGVAGTAPEAASHILEADGDENFEFRLASGAGFSAIGFDLYTNAFAAPVVSLYAAGGALIGSVTVAQAPNRLGFFGATSTTPIAAAVIVVDRGWIENTAVDNVRLGNVIAGVPEPASWALLAIGFGFAGAALRRQRPVAA